MSVADPNLPVRFGLLGYGFGGRWFHAPLLRAAPEVDLLGVVTSSPERRALVTRDAPGLRTFDSLEQLAEAGAEAVAISTPASTHSELTDRALELGLAVVCDKPFALDAAAATRSVELAFSGFFHLLVSRRNRPAKPPSPPTTSGRPARATRPFISSTARSPASMSTPAAA